jgi:uncharacterized membrane protein
LALRLKTSLWVIPFVCALAGIALSLITVAIDRSLGEVIPRSITGDPTSALTILSTIAYSMVSLTALVVTITAVVVQLAMGQFSPRSVRPFLHDRPSQFAIGVFVGAFAHAMFAMREVQSFTERGSVPGVTIVVAYVLVFVSVTLLVGYVHHIGNSLKADSIIESVGAETRTLLDKLYGPASPTNDELDPRVITVARSGVIFEVDRDALVAVAEAADVMLELLHPIGTFVPGHAPLFRCEGGREGLDLAAIRRAVAIGPERTMDQDGAFGLQILVDIVERSLSEGFSDQTTACQGIDRLHDILRSLAGRRFPSGRHSDSNGVERLIVPELGWDDYVGIAFDRTIVAAARSTAVLQRMRAALEDLATVTSDEQRPAIDSRLGSVLDALAPEERANARQRAVT